jgi:hypothetical protein
MGHRQSLYSGGQREVSKFESAQRDERAANPPTIGPVSGPQTAPMDQIPIIVASCQAGYKSPMEAPPLKNAFKTNLERQTIRTVASAGEPAKPVK